MVPVRRALRLIIDGKAEIVETDGEGVVRSVTLSVPRPAVIRLVRFIHVPRRFRRQVDHVPEQAALAKRHAHPLP